MAEGETGPRGLGELLTGSDMSVGIDQIGDCCMFSDMDGDDDWEDIRERMIRDSCAYYAQEMLTTKITPQFPDGKFVVGPHHIKWDAIVALCRKICILAARGHGKTAYWTFAYPIWKADSIPNGTGYIFSDTQDQASKILETIKLEIEENPKLKHLLPRKRSKRRWGTRAIKLSNGHTIYARGYNTSFRGGHPDWIVIDDGLNDETMFSETTRNKQISTFVSAITPMLMAHTQIIIVGTPFFDGDLYTKIKNTPSYAFFEFPALDENDNPLWPEMYSKAALDEALVDMGPIAFTREYLCQPISDDMSLFPSYLFKGEPVEQPTVCLGMPRKFWAGMGIDTVAMGVDFALSASVKADWTVVFTMGMDKLGNRWIMDIRREQGMEYQHQLSLITEVARLYRPGVIFLESNQMQRIFGDELIRTTDLPIIEFTTGVEKHALDKGVPGLRIILENKKVRIPRGDEASVEMTNRWRDEMKCFTWKDGKLEGVGSNDDMVMSFWLCEQALQFGGLQFGFEGDSTGLPEEKPEEEDVDEYDDDDDGGDVPW